MGMNTLLFTVEEGGLGTNGVVVAWILRREIEDTMDFSVSLDFGLFH